MKYSHYLVHSLSLARTALKIKDVKGQTCILDATKTTVRFHCHVVREASIIKQWIAKSFCLVPCVLNFLIALLFAPFISIQQSGKIVLFYIYNFYLVLNLWPMVYAVKLIFESTMFKSIFDSLFRRKLCCQFYKYFV
jgi:hypothetical protein